MEPYSEALFQEVDTYIANLLAIEDKPLKSAIETATAAGLPPISVSANQGKFLQVLAKSCRARRILELGTLAGYSTIWMARALPKDGQLITIEFDPRHAAVAGQNIRHAALDHIVEIRVGKALDILPLLAAENPEPFDLVFIDADKPPYLEYFRWALKLTRPGSLIVLDNVVREGKVLETDCADDRVTGVQRLNSFLSTCPGITATIVQTVGAKEHDGMAVVVVD